MERGTASTQRHGKYLRGLSARASTCRRQSAQKVAPQIYCKRKAARHDYPKKILLAASSEKRRVRRNFLVQVLAGCVHRDSWFESGGKIDNSSIINAASICSTRAIINLVNYEVQQLAGSAKKSARHNNTKKQQVLATFSAGAILRDDPEDI